METSGIDPGLRLLGIQKIKAELARRERIRKDREALADRHEEIRENCKTMHGFTREAWHVLEPTEPFKDNWHIGAVCEHLDAVHSGEIAGKILQINMPPGTMKSLTVSVLFNPYEWGPGNSPGLRYLATAYKEDLVNRDCLKSRALIMSEWYQTLWPSVKLIKSGDTEFINTYFGRRKSIPFLSLTGDRGNRLLIDDPHSLKLAESEVDRPKTVQHFRESAPSRLNNPLRDVIIVMMQRMHPEDVCGIIEELGLDVVRLIMPMEYVPSLTVKTPLFEDPRKDLGELLHPERYPKEKIEKDKVLLGNHAFDTQFQQQPRARDGTYFFNRTHLLIPGRNEDGVETWEPARPTQVDAVFTVLDTASKKGAKRDGTGAVHCGYCQFPEPHGFVLDWDIIQIEAAMLEEWLPNVLKRGEELAGQYMARSGYTGAHIEDKDSGIALIQKMQGKGLPVQAIPSELTALGKEGRALSVSGYANNGLMKITEHAFNKIVVYKGRSRNHFVDQVTTFRMGHGTPLDEDELFDIWCYILALAFGNDKGL